MGARNLHIQLCMVPINIYMVTYYRAYVLRITAGAKSYTGFIDDNFLFVYNHK